MGKPLIVFILGLLVYGAFAGDRLRIHSQDNHFVYLADAFLKGSSELVRVPHHGNDWASFVDIKTRGKTAKTFGDHHRGFFTLRPNKPNEFKTLSGEILSIPKHDIESKKTRYFVSFPPLPAVLLMPFVAAIGYGTNDVLFTIVFAALNCSVLFLLLGRLREGGHTHLSDHQRLWMVACFGLGSAHLWCGVLGQVWFTALIVGVTFHLAFIYFASDLRRPFLAGICLSAAFSTRAPLVFGAIFFYWQLFFGAHRPSTRHEFWRSFVAFTAPCMVVGCALLAYNFNRFESIFEFGHTYLAGGTIPRIRDYGLFNIHFLPKNLEAAFTLIPSVKSSIPFIHLSKHGMSIFLSMPVLVYLIGSSSNSALARPAWVTTSVIGALLLVYQNTGWEQFSYRFLLDVLPYLLVLLCVGHRPMGRMFKLAIIVGVVINILGAATFQRDYARRMYSYEWLHQNGDSAAGSAIVAVQGASITSPRPVVRAD